MKTFIKVFTMLSMCLVLTYSPAVAQTTEPVDNTRTTTTDDRINDDDDTNWGWIGLVGLLGLLGLRKNHDRPEDRVHQRAEH